MAWKIRVILPDGDEYLPDDEFDTEEEAWDFTSEIANDFSAGYADVEDPVDPDDLEFEVYEV